MGAEQSSQRIVTQKDGAKRPFAGVIVGGLFMAPHPDRTAEERRADAKLVDRIARHMS